MRTTRGLLALPVLLSLVMIGVLVQAAMAKDIAKITKEELKAKLSDANVVVVDVRLGKDWKASEEKIKGAVRVEGDQIDTLASTYPKEKTLVFYCA